MTADFTSTMNIYSNHGDKVVFMNKNGYDGEHKLFSEQDVLDFMQGQEVYSVDHHKVIVE